MRLRTLTSSTLALALIITGPAAASATGLGSADAPAGSQAATTGELTLLATTEIYTLSLHDALPISLAVIRRGRSRR